MNAAVLTGAYAASASLLVVAGAAKAVRPHDTARALAVAGLPLGVVAVRIGAVAELMLGAAALTTKVRLVAVLVAISYFVFAGFVALARSRGGPISSCGCFGEPDAPATALHVVLDLAAGGVAVAIGAGHPPAFVTIVRGQAYGGIPLATLTVVMAYLFYLAMAVLPRTLAAARSTS